MYRQADRRDPLPPTIIEYESKLVRKRMFFIAALIAVIALFSFSGLHMAILSCDQTRCRLDSYALYVRGERHIEVARDDVVWVKAVARGSGKNRYADAHLIVKSAPPIDLSGAAWLGRLGQDVTLEAAARFNDAFARGEPNISVWLRPHALTIVFMFLFGSGLSAVVFAIVREQIRQLRKIRIAVDHDAGVVRANGREMRIANVASVNVATGDALFWSRKKHEKLLGHRIVLHPKDDGVALVATPDFRAGPKKDHERAARQLRAAIGVPAKKS